MLLSTTTGRRVRRGNITDVEKLAYHSRDVGRTRLVAAAVLGLALGRGWRGTG